MKKTYHIYSSRPDERPYIIATFDADPKDNDEEARERLKKSRADSSNDWDDLYLERVDIKEVVSRITDAPSPKPS